MTNVIQLAPTPVPASELGTLDNPIPFTDENVVSRLASLHHSGRQCLEIQYCGSIRKVYSVDKNLYVTGRHGSTYFIFMESELGKAA